MPRAYDSRRDGVPEGFFRDPSGHFPQPGLCGEEEMLALGYTADDVEHARQAAVHEEVESVTGRDPALDTWRAFAAGTGKNTRKHILRTIDNIDTSLRGFGVAATREMDAAMTGRGSPMTDREKFVVSSFVRAFSAALAQVRAEVEGAP